MSPSAVVEVDPARGSRRARRFYGRPVRAERVRASAGPGIAAVRRPGPSPRSRSSCSPAMRARKRSSPRQASVARRPLAARRRPQGLVVASSVEPARRPIAASWAPQGGRPRASARASRWTLRLGQPRHRRAGPGRGQGAPAHDARRLEPRRRCARTWSSRAGCPARRSVKRLGPEDQLAHDEQRHSARRRGRARAPPRSSPRADRVRRHRPSVPDRSRVSYTYGCQTLTARYDGATGRAGRRSPDLRADRRSPAPRARPGPAAGGRTGRRRARWRVCGSTNGGQLSVRAHVGSRPAAGRRRRGRSCPAGRLRLAPRMTIANQATGRAQLLDDLIA